jgi:glyceraldehyde 3-phosphate dehydrogenase
MFFHEKEISNLPWKSLDINYVIEATGKYKTFEDLNAHIIAGAKKVILSAPSEVDSKNCCNRCKRSYSRRDRNYYF